jgi:glycosyltransferase involved in cell wall biosynthesis
LTIARHRRLPLVVTVHGGALDLPKSVQMGLDEPAHRGVEWGRVFGLVLQSRRLFALADAILTCNAQEAALLRAQYPTQRIIVQPHGVPVSLYQANRRPEARAAFPQIRGRSVLLCVGRIDPVKNQRWLVEQAPTLLARYPAALLVFAGACTDLTYGQCLRRRLAELGLTERVCFTGGLLPDDPRLIGLMQEARAVVLPSISETFGLVILEAWAAGTAVMASGTSGAMSLVKPEQNGWLFDLKAPNQFHAAVDQALLQPHLASRFAAAGHQLVCAEYDSAVVAGRMTKLYEQLIEENHALRHSARR